MRVPDQGCGPRFANGCWAGLCSGADDRAPLATTVARTGVSLRCCHTKYMFVLAMSEDCRIFRYCHAIPCARCLLTVAPPPEQVTALYRAAIETGLQNILYVAALFAAGRMVHPVVFLAGTSFVHYPRYIATYYHRGSDLDFGRFKSDALFLKVVALSHVACRYASALLTTFRSSAGEVAAAAAVESGEVDDSGGGGGGGHDTAVMLAAASIAMIVAGAAVSVLASRALGVDGTYFGPELGICEMKWVTAFPYSCVPHPMIVGQLVAFAGVHLLPEFRAAWPWLMPAHCALYLLVMAQEHLDFHAKADKSGRVPGYGGTERSVAAATKKKVP